MTGHPRNDEGQKRAVHVLGQLIRTTAANRKVSTLGITCYQARVPQHTSGSLLGSCSFNLIHNEGPGGVQDKCCTHHPEGPGGNARPECPYPTTLLDDMLHGGDAAPVLRGFFWDNICLHSGLDGIKRLCGCDSQESASDSGDDEGGLGRVAL